MKILHFFQQEAACDEEEDIELDDDEIITMFSDEKFYPTALDKMIGSIALLLEEARHGPYVFRTLYLNVAGQALHIPAYFASCFHFLVFIFRELHLSDSDMKCFAADKVSGIF